MTAEDKSKQAASTIESWIAEDEQLQKKYELALKERDNYAKALAIALKEGIFAHKADVKRRINEVLGLGGNDEWG